MRGLGNTLARLSATSRAKIASPAERGSSRLTPLEGFGSNPGALDALVHIPDDLPSGAPLVVVLHGCTQNGDGYDHGSGWSRLAERHGFAVLFPQQRRANNPNLCFNWYGPADARRGRGEALSIRQMVGHLVKQHGLDPARLFVTGLSAGGAMTAVMLATYPELFAGGAVIAGLPFATADTLGEALERMRGQGGPGHDQLSRLVARASDHRGPWPTLSVWHGTHDSIVDPINADALVEQWRVLHAIPADAATVGTVDGHRHTVWRDASGRDAVERFDIKGMGHGTPLDPRGDEECGSSGPHMLDVGICSTSHIARSWGLLGKRPKKAAAPIIAHSQSATAQSATAQSAKVQPAKAQISKARPANAMRSAGPKSDQDGVTAVIENALRAAGLMR